MENLTELWRGEFGDQYHDRCRPTHIEINKRILMMRRVFALIPNEIAPKVFLEVGAGSGANLAAIDAIYENEKRERVLMAVEPNASAREIIPHILHADVQLLDDVATKITLPDECADMVFTSGVLIHIPDPDLLTVMGEIYRCTKPGRFIMCAEYFSPSPRAIQYRGHEALWARDYGSIWLDNFSVKCVGYGFEWKKTTGLDNITWTLLTKTGG